MPDVVFINYRRSLNAKDAQLLRLRLQQSFEPKEVFLDTSGLDGGDHWLHTLEKQVDASSAMVVLIGTGWATTKNEKGERRLDDANDFVRFEIARAFSRNIPVLPVLVDGATMPDISMLPTNLVPLSFPQAMLLRVESADDDADKIARRLKSLIASGRSAGIARRTLFSAVVGTLVVGVICGAAICTLLGFASNMDTAKTKRKIADSESRAQQAETKLRTAQEALLKRLKMRKEPNKWVEDNADLFARPGMTYEQCERMCLERLECVFMEFAREDNGCGLYSRIPNLIRPDGNGDIAFKE